MPILPDYQHFGGVYWDTTALYSALAYQGVTAPHTGEPLSEAMLLGISGGITFGYTTFTRKGYDPRLVLLTRNTFHPVETICKRLDIPCETKLTDSPGRSTANLIKALEGGTPALVWADMYSLPYHHLPRETGLWISMPVVVYGYDIESGTVNIADRSQQPLTITARELADARARNPKIRHKLVTLGEPDMTRFPDAVYAGIQDCIHIFREGVNKPQVRGKMGFAGLRRWAMLLTEEGKKKSWAKQFPPGAGLFSAVVDAFGYIETWGTQSGASRGMYADFLEEAAVLLNRPGLDAAAEHFRTSAAAWRALAHALLPEHVEPFRETRELILRKNQLFHTKGQTANGEILNINRRLDKLRTQIEKRFPMSDDQSAVLREDLSEHVQAIHDLETTAVSALEDAIS